MLQKNFPGVPIHDDVQTYAAATGSADVITAGFPCQDISLAGKGEGLDGSRSELFFDAARIIRDVGPRIVVLENVSALLARGLGRVVRQLAEIGYVNGIAYQLPVLALRTYVTGSGLLPTPSAVDYGTNKGGSNPDGPERPSLQTMARQNRWPTPTSTDGRRSAESPEAIEARGANQGVTLNDAVAQLVTTPDANCWKGGNRRRQLTDPVYGITPDGGQLNPTWVEWLMGYPEGWTDLED